MAHIITICCCKRCACWSSNPDALHVLPKKMTFIFTSIRIFYISFRFSRITQKKSRYREFSIFFSLSFFPFHFLAGNTWPAFLNSFSLPLNNTARSIYAPRASSRPVCHSLESRGNIKSASAGGGGGFCAYVSTSAYFLLLLSCGLEWIYIHDTITWNRTKKKREKLHSLVGCRLFLSPATVFDFNFFILFFSRYENDWTKYLKIKGERRK